MLPTAETAESLAMLRSFYFDVYGSGLKQGDPMRFASQLGSLVPRGGGVCGFHVTELGSVGGRAGSGEE